MFCGNDANLIEIPSRRVLTFFPFKSMDFTAFRSSPLELKLRGLLSFWLLHTDETNTFTYWNEHTLTWFYAPKNANSVKTKRM